MRALHLGFTFRWQFGYNGAAVEAPLASDIGKWTERYNSATTGDFCTNFPHRNNRKLLKAINNYLGVLKCRFKCDLNYFDSHIPLK